MSASSWPSAESIVNLAFEARDRGEYRQEVLRRVMNVAGCEIGLFSSMEAPPLASDLVNLSVSVAERTQREMRDTSAELSRILGVLSAKGAAVDTELYNARERDRLTCYRTQRSLGVTSSLLVLLPPGRTGARMICLSKAGGQFSAPDAQCAQRLLRALTVGDDALEPASAPSALALLTTRQREIVRLVAAGWSNPQIGRMCGISPNTVRNHLANIFVALEVSTRTELALLSSAWSTQAPADPPPTAKNRTPAR